MPASNTNIPASGPAPQPVADPVPDPAPRPAPVRGAAPKGKRVSANARTRTRIARALVRLMASKPYSDITVTDIVTRAGVARASYYRNFASKEDVLLSAAASVFDGYRTKAREQGIDVFEYEGILLIFRYFNAYRQPILVTYRAGLSSLFLRAFDEHIDEIAGDMSCTQISRYLLPFISGGLFNVFSKWLEGGLRETPEEMARLMAAAIQSLPLPPRS